MPEQNPLTSFRCQKCGQNAPLKYRKHGQFKGRMAWLRRHYKDKHPEKWSWKNPTGTARTDCKYTCGFCGDVLHSDRAFIDHLTYYHAIMPSHAIASIKKHKERHGFR